MALTLQRKLELAGALSKLQPQLQRLHLVEKPKPRHRLRNAVLVGGMIAAGAVVAVVLYRRQGCCDGAVAGSGEDAQARSPAQSAPDTLPDGEGPASDAGRPQDVLAQMPA